MYLHCVYTISQKCLNRGNLSGENTMKLANVYLGDVRDGRLLRKLGMHVVISVTKESGSYITGLDVRNRFHQVKSFVNGARRSV